MKQRALFLDRDGTLVYPVHYPTRPEQLRLYRDLGPQLRVLQHMGFLMVVITNQSGLARGYFSAEELDRMHEHLRTQLLDLGVKLAGIYHCPHHPEGTVPEFALECECRKPAPGMLLRAAQDLDIELSRSWLIGDILDDIEAGKRAGCRTVLVDLETEPAPECALRQPDFVACSTRHALQIIHTVETLSPRIDLLYQPASWRQKPEQR